MQNSYSTDSSASTSSRYADRIVRKTVLYGMKRKKEKRCRKSEQKKIHEKGVSSKETIMQRRWGVEANNWFSSEERLTLQTQVSLLQLIKPNIQKKEKRRLVEKTVRRKKCSECLLSVTRSLGWTSLLMFFPFHYKENMNNTRTKVNDGMKTIWPKLPYAGKRGEILVNNNYCTTKLNLSYVMLLL